MAFLYVGVDIDKRHHHITVIDQDGIVVSRQQVVNDPAHLTPLITLICHRRHNIRRAIDICTGPAEPLIALLHARTVDLRG